MQSFFCSHFHNIYRFISCGVEGKGGGGSDVLKEQISHAWSRLCQYFSHWLVFLHTLVVFTRWYCFREAIFGRPPPHTHTHNLSYLKRTLISAGSAELPDGCLLTRVCVCECVRAAAAWMFTSIWGWVGKRAREKERLRWKGEREGWREGNDAERRKGREDSVQWGEREKGGKKKEKAAGKGETGRTRQLPIDAGALNSGAPRSADTGRWSQ